MLFSLKPKFPLCSGRWHWCCSNSWLVSESIMNGLLMATNKYVDKVARKQEFWTKDTGNWYSLLISMLRFVLEYDNFAEKIPPDWSYCDKQRQIDELYFQHRIPISQECVPLSLQWATSVWKLIYPARCTTDRVCWSEMRQIRNFICEIFNNGQSLHCLLQRNKFILKHSVSGLLTFQISDHHKGMRKMKQNSC